jgi:hypothetical protein
VSTASLPYKKRAASNAIIARDARGGQLRGDLEGHGSVEMLGAQAQAHAGYVALEYITGRLHGREGAFALLHISTLDGPRLWGEFPIVPGSGTGDLQSIRGQGRIDRDAEGHHTFTLDYELG